MADPANPNSKELKRLVTRLPDEWIKVIKIAARKHKVLPAQWLRQLIDESPELRQIASEKNIELPSLEIHRGGARKQNLPPYIKAHLRSVHARGSVRESKKVEWDITRPDDWGDDDIEG